MRSVEDRETFEERDGDGFVAGLAAAAAFIIWNETVGIDDSCSAFAFAHIATETERLAKSQPALCREAVLDDRAPKDEHVDARVTAACAGVLRHGERRGDAVRAPGLDPGQSPGFELGDYLVGDFLIEAHPVLIGTSARGRM